MRRGGTACASDASSLRPARLAGAEWPSSGAGGGDLRYDRSSPTSLLVCIIDWSAIASSGQALDGGDGHDQASPPHQRISNRSPSALRHSSVKISHRGVAIERHRQRLAASMMTPDEAAGACRAGSYAASAASLPLIADMFCGRWRIGDGAGPTVLGG